MNKRIAKVSVLSLVVVMLFGLIASPAMAADFWFETTEEYLASTTLLDISHLTDQSDYTSVTDGHLTVSFDTPMRKLTVPTTWSEPWGSPPAVELYQPHVLFTKEVNELTITLDKPCRIFGLELQPNKMHSYWYGLQFYAGDSAIAGMAASVDGAVSAKLFAARHGVFFDKVVIYFRSDLSYDDDPLGFAIAQIRYDTWDGWVTGGGIIKDENGRKTLWSISGNAMWDEACGWVGRFQIRDFQNKMSYHLDAIEGLGFEGNVTGSPYAIYNEAMIIASGRDQNGNPVKMWISIKDAQEPGKGYDAVSVYTQNASYTELFSGIIDGGNFQVHPPESPAD